MRQWLASQRNYFLLALAFFTRLPIPADTPYSAERLNRASRYFGLVGLVVGLLNALILWAGHLLFPLSVAILLSLVFSLLLTGAFHEDGLTDMSDGIGGGLSRERKLSIMKDSRIGTYGAVTLFMALLLKYTLLQELATPDLSVVLLALILMHPLSRILSGTLLFDMRYVQDESSSKSKPLANQQNSTDLLLLLLTAALLLLLLSWQAASLMILMLTLFRYLFRHWLNGHLGGYTGDCLGGAQQLAELLGYLLLLALHYHHIPLSNHLLHGLTGA